MTSSAGPLPNFIIIGAPRCGTTSLARYLGAHPDVFVADEKEVNFFMGRYHLGLDWYRSRFSDASTETAIGEASPRYMYSTHVPERMMAALPNVRLIAILRNPVDRAYSHYWMRRARGRESRSFAEVVAADRDDRDDGSGKHGSDYLALGRYRPWLERMTSYFPRESLSVVILEHFRHEPAVNYASLCEFLGVDPRFTPRNLNSSINAFATFRSLAARRVARRLPTLPRRVIDRLNTRNGQYPPMERELRRGLIDLFQGENERLASWIGTDLSMWSR